MPGGRASFLRYFSCPDCQVPVLIKWPPPSAWELGVCGGPLGERHNPSFQSERPGWLQLDHGNGFSCPAWAGKACDFCEAAVCFLVARGVCAGVFWEGCLREVAFQLPCLFPAERHAWGGCDGTEGFARCRVGSLIRLLSLSLIALLNAYTQPGSREELWPTI